jgi:hypothetical protein
MMPGMTNHPRRRHDPMRDHLGEARQALAAAERMIEDVTRDELPLPGPDGEDVPRSAGDLAAEVPAVKELADEMAAQPPQQVPPGFSPNGHPATAKVVEQLIGQLPQMLFQAVAAALSQVQVTVKPGPCGTCFTTRVSWFTVHSAEIARAEAAYQAALSELAPDDPQRAMIQPLSFLPDALQPSPDPAKPNPQAMPGLTEGVIVIGGTWYCAGHVPGVQQQQPGKLLVAETMIPQGMLGQLFRGQAA